MFQDVLFMLWTWSGFLTELPECGMFNRSVVRHRKISNEEKPIYRDDLVITVYRQEVFASF